MIDNTKLKRLADAAKNWGGEVGEDRWYTAECFNQPYFSVPDAEFIAAANPASVLALIAENDQSRDGANMRAIRSLRGDCADLKAERDQLKAENEALRKRIDDMSPFKGAPLTGPDLKCLACGGYHYGLQGLPCPKMLAIASAAMGKGEQS